MKALIYGNIFESYAREILKKHGYKILERNFKSNIGEIDIIAMKGSTISFIEVKARYIFSCFSPMEAVNEKKISRIIHTAAKYLVMLKNKNININAFNYSFDAIFVAFDKETFSMTHYIDFCVVNKDDLCGLTL